MDYQGMDHLQQACISDLFFNYDKRQWQDVLDREHGEGESEHWTEPSGDAMKALTNDAETFSGILEPLGIHVTPDELKKDSIRRYFGHG